LKPLSDNVFGEFRKQSEDTLRKALEKTYPDLANPELLLEVPPSNKFGELASSICFELSKSLHLGANEIAKRIVEKIDVSTSTLISSVELAGSAYINFRLNYEQATQRIVEGILRSPESYGYLKTDAPKRIIVEHTSVNPIHAIHIGQARNPILGDALARMLKARGHNVSRHYYIDDMGRQTAIIAYGYEKIGRPTPDIKPDHFMGQIYSITACLMEIQRAKKQQATVTDTTERQTLQKEFDEWTSVASELEKKYPRTFNDIKQAISLDPDPEENVNQLIRDYESGQEKTKQLVRHVAEICLGGFRETLSRLDIHFDSWDWESDLLWSRRVSKIMEELMKTPYVHELQGTLELDVERVVDSLGLRKDLNLSSSYHLPPLTLGRSDGTTLYTTRDMAYSIQKSELAGRVVNVIGAEQTLPQLQLKVALYALGKAEIARNQEHFAFGLIELSGYKMSSRRGRFIALDDVIDEAITKAHEEVSKRMSKLSEEEKRSIANSIGLSSMKYALLCVEPAKTVLFTWDRVLDFEKNSAAFINYAYTRISGILRKLGEYSTSADYSKLTHPLEKELLILLSRFPEIFVKASDNLRPDDLANYANKLTEKFHEYYEKVNVIRSESLDVRNARAGLIEATRIVLKNAMNVLGINLLERM
jgi:arginyl-tRNA synthetase